MAVTKNRKVWLFYNGRFLNDVVDDNEKLAEQRKDKWVSLGYEETKITQLEKEFQKRREISSKTQIKFGSTAEKVLPAITTSGPCEITVNIGLMPFRARIEDLQAGLHP